MIDDVNVADASSWTADFRTRLTAVDEPTAVREKYRVLVRNPGSYTKNGVMSPIECTHPSVSCSMATAVIGAPPVAEMRTVAACWPTAGLDRVKEKM